MMPNECTYASGPGSAMGDAATRVAAMASRAKMAAVKRMCVDGVVDEGTNKDASLLYSATEPLVLRALGVETF